MDKRQTDEPAAGPSAKVPRHDDGAQPSTSAASALLTLICTLCNATFMWSKDLARHIECQHGGSAFVCDICSKSFVRKDTLTRHMKTHAKTPKAYDCTDCDKTFLLKSSLTQHLKTHVILNCDECGKTFKTKAALTSHKKTHKAIPLARAGDPQPTTDPRDPTSATCPPKGCKTALKGSFERHRVQGTETDIDLPAFLRSQPHADLIKDAVNKKKSVKFFISANVKMIRPKNWITCGDQETFPYFTSRCARVLEVSDVGDLLETAYQKIEDSLTQYLREGSGWVIGHVKFVDLVISTYKPMKGSSFIPLPDKLANTKSIINVQNEDQKCFLWAILSALHPILNNPQRLGHYQQLEESLDMGNLTFPMTPDAIPKFEKMNSLRINLFGYREKQVFPIYISEETGQPINLLLISNGTNQH